MSRRPPHATGRASDEGNFTADCSGEFLYRVRWSFLGSMRKDRSRICQILTRLLVERLMQLVGEEQFLTDQAAIPVRLECIILLDHRKRSLRGRRKTEASVKTQTFDFSQ